MIKTVRRIVLAASGGLLVTIGSAFMFKPKVFLEMSDVFIDHDAGLISELTAPSGVLLISGALLVLGAVKSRFDRLAVSTGLLVYGGYGLSRLLSMMLHGIPSASLVAAAVLELTIAATLLLLRILENSNDRLSVEDICLVV